MEPVVVFGSWTVAPASVVCLNCAIALFGNLLLHEVRARYESFLLLPLTLTVFSALLILTLKSTSEIDRPSCSCRSAGIVKRSRNANAPEDLMTLAGTTRLVIPTGAPGREF